MSVDVEIYMSNIIKFFTKNEKDLLNLIPKSMEQKFYNRIREVAVINDEKGVEVCLTQKQLIEICAELNGKKIKENKIRDIIVQTPFGHYSLN
jgi:hypothetical protein